MRNKAKEEIELFLQKHIAKIHEYIYKETSRVIDEKINNENFIDEIIERINKKQLK